MKRPGLKTISITALIIAGLIVLLAIVGIATFRWEAKAVTGFGDWRENRSWSGPDNYHSDTAFGGLFITNWASHSLPHRTYQKIADSIKAIKDSLDEKYNSFFVNYQGFENLGYGSLSKNSDSRSLFKKIDSFPAVRQLDDSISLLYNQYYRPAAKDSIVILKAIINALSEKKSALTSRAYDSLAAQSEKDRLYFFILGNYSVTEGSKFFIRDNTYNLAYLKWDTLMRPGDTSIVGEYTSKPLGFRYAADKKRIMLPISKGTFSMLSMAAIPLAMIMLFLLAYTYIGLPIHILLSISRGKAFTQKNISALHIMSAVLVIHGVLATCTPYIFHFFYRHIIPEDFSLPPVMSRLYDNAYFLLLSLIIFIIASAFKKGYRLQQETELTV